MKKYVIMNNSNMNRIIKNLFAFKKGRLQGTVAMLCMVCTVFIAILLASGCSVKNESPIMDDRSFIQKINEAPVALVSKDEFPEWLIEKIEFHETYKSPLKIFQGIWNGHVMYFLQMYFSSCFMCGTYYENGEIIVWADGIEADKFGSQSKDWVLIYELTLEQIVSESLFENFYGAPVAIVSKEDLPEWLQEKIEYLWDTYILRHTYRHEKLEIFRGEWNKRTIYHLWHTLSSNNAEIYYEDGNRIVFSCNINDGGLLVGTFMSEWKNWELIYQIAGGVVTEQSTKSATRKLIEDRYEFPDISGMNDWWGDPDIIKKRLDALQMPDAILASISTAGLLETCLEFPYLLDIHNNNNK